VKVAIVIDVPDEWEDINHESGFTKAGYGSLMRELSSFEIVEGPMPLPSTYSPKSNELGSLG